MQGYINARINNDKPTRIAMVVRGILIAVAFVFLTFVAFVCH